MFIVYILSSIIGQHYYVGHTADKENRLREHNAGEVRATKPYRPWKMIYTEEYNTKSEAQSREYEIKSYKGGIKFKKLIEKFKDK